ncbi:MAG: flagellar basal body rod protein FlgB [Ignavibacteriae bacterium]|nr:flagellar basal body rod protein FlgB [Ignavibacteriota bacterium]
MRLFDSTKIPLLGKALDVYSLRQKVMASNISNITVPGYKSQSVSFEEQLAAAEKNSGAVRGAATNPKHLSISAATDIRDVQEKVYDTSEDKPEGYNELASGFNDVDIDYEMAELAKNQIRFRFGSRLLGDTFKGIQKAIRGSV